MYAGHPPAIGPPGRQTAPEIELNLCSGQTICALQICLNAPPTRPWLHLPRQTNLAAHADRQNICPTQPANKLDTKN